MLDDQALYSRGLTTLFTGKVGIFIADGEVAIHPESRGTRTMAGGDTSVYD